MNTRRLKETCVTKGVSTKRASSWHYDKNEQVPAGAGHAGSTGGWEWTLGAMGKGERGWASVLCGSKDRPLEWFALGFPSSFFFPLNVSIPTFWSPQNYFLDLLSWSLESPTGDEQIFFNQYLVNTYHSAWHTIGVPQIFAKITDFLPSLTSPQNFFGEGKILPWQIQLGPPYLITPHI